jgi:Insertion element 4 transposase N-terminal
VRSDEDARWRLSDAVSIGLLVEAFPEDAVDAAVDRAGVREQINRALPARLMVYFMLACWLWSGCGYVRVLRDLVAGLRWARGGYEGWKAPFDGSISKARGRLGEAVLADLFGGCAGAVGGPEDAGVFFRGLRVAAIDGAVHDLERTPENQAVFATPPGGVFPQVRLTVLAECGTLAVIDAAFDSIAEDEQALSERLLGSLDAGMLVLADQESFSRNLYAKSAATGAQLAWRMPAADVLPVLERLPDGTYRSELPGLDKDRRIAVRVVEFTVDDRVVTKDVGTPDGEAFAIATTLLDPERHPAEELARLYLKRWTAELVFEILNVRVRPTHATLRSKSPAMVRQELHALLCCYQAVRRVRDPAAHAAGPDPRRIRFPNGSNTERRAGTARLRREDPSLETLRPTAGRKGHQPTADAQAVTD